MRLIAVELTRLELELVKGLETSTGVLASRPVVLVRVVTDAGEGVGECAALAAPTYTAEYADGAEQVLATILIPRLFAVGDFDGPAGALAALEVVRGHPIAKAALEMALLDAEGHERNRSLAASIGARSSSVVAGATIGLAPGTREVLDAVEAAVEAGYERVKCKIAPGRDVGVLAAVRREHPGLVLLADANGSYRLERPDHRSALRQLDGLGLAALEQPLAAGDLVGHASLAVELETPVMLDESVPDLHALDNALALAACDAVSLKPARLGGIAAACEAVRRCVAAGVSCTVGGMLETGIGRAASLAVAALPGVDLPSELGASDRYFAEDLTAPHVLVAGRLAVPDGPGLGIELAARVVAAHTVRTRRLASSGPPGLS